MATYASSSEIKFDTGRPITALLDEDLSSTEQSNVIRVARQRAFEKINSQLTGRTAVPAFHIPSLKQVEIDYVIADLISGAYTLETVNQSDWGEKYQSRAEETLGGLRFEASADEPVSFRGNTGNGRLSITEVFSEFCKTEMWTLRALSATEFTIVGSVSGNFPNITVGESYPEKDWSSGTIADYGLTLSNYPTVGNTPFMLKLVAGSTAFEDGDVFTFKTYGSEARAKGISTGKLVRA